MARWKTMLNLASFLATLVDEVLVAGSAQRSHPRRLLGRFAVSASAASLQDAPSRHNTRTITMKHPTLFKDPSAQVHIESQPNRIETPAIDLPSFEISIVQ
jgi:hypothetical protein